MNQLEERIAKFLEGKNLAPDFARRLAPDLARTFNDYLNEQLAALPTTDEARREAEDAEIARRMSAAKKTDELYHLMRGGLTLEQKLVKLLADRTNPSLGHVVLLARDIAALVHQDFQEEYERHSLEEGDRIRREMT